MGRLCILTQEEVLPPLQQYVEMADIPERFGGDVESYHGIQPALDPDMLSWQSRNPQIPKEPMKGINEGWEKKAAVAFGSSRGGVRNEKIAVLCPKDLIRK